MTATPLLSVFMPTYNGERYVREAIESVLENGCRDLELVVLDDCSTDATVTVVEAIGHPAVRLSRNPRNLGVVETRRRGLPLLRGQYLALLDQDDLAVAGRFAAQLARLESAGGPDIIGGAIENFGDLGGVKNFYVSDAEIRASLLFNASIANPAATMKLAPLREGLIEYSLTAGPAADYALWVDAAMAGLRLENLATVVTRYRRHAASMTQTGFGEMIACAAGVRKRVADIYFPEWSDADRSALVSALSGNSESLQHWRAGIFALSRAALAAHTIPGIDHALMVRMLSEHAMRLITDEVGHGRVNFATLEAMVDENSSFEQWRAAENGALDIRIMALFDQTAANLEKRADIGQTTSVRMRRRPAPVRRRHQQ